MTNGSTILVTGGAGFLGSHTCLDLLDHGFEVVVVDNHCNSSPRALDRVQKLAGHRLTAYEVDIRDRDALGEVFAAHPIDVVIHFAGKKAVGESLQIPLAYYDINVGGTATLLRVMEVHNVQQIVFSSSCSIYGNAIRLPLDEDSPAGPTNPYARSKWIREQMLADACARWPELSVIALRYFNPAGAHPSGELGEDPTEVPKQRDALRDAGRGRPARGDLGVRRRLPNPRRLVRPRLHPCRRPRRRSPPRRRAPGRPSRPARAQPRHGAGVSVLELIAAFCAVSGTDLP